MKTINLASAHGCRQVWYLFIILAHTVCHSWHLSVSYSITLLGLLTEGLISLRYTTSPPMAQPNENLFTEVVLSVQYHRVVKSSTESVLGTSTYLCVSCGAVGHVTAA